MHPQAGRAADRPRRRPTAHNPSAGAVSVAQDADTCVVYGMPKAVAEAGLVDVVAPLDRIAAEIVKTVQ